MTLRTLFNNLIFIILGWQKQLGLPINYKIAKVITILVACIYQLPILMYQAGMLYILVEAYLAFNK
jgi:NhaP-type Na+/H+ or K+/H+ antiporter